MKRFPLFVFFISLLPTSVLAAPMAFTSSAAFDSAVADLGQGLSVLDFESFAPGALIADGATVDGITFDSSTLEGFGVSLQVDDFFATSSGSQYLATDDGGVFLSGDTLSFSFAPTAAIGMWFVTGETPSPSCTGGVIICSDDIVISAGGASAGIEVGSEMLLPDGGFAFFVGLVDSMATFSTATITTTDASIAAFTWHLDDISRSVISVDAIATRSGMFFVALGMMALGFLRRSASGIR